MTTAAKGKRCLVCILVGTCIGRKLSSDDFECLWVILFRLDDKTWNICIYLFCLHLGETSIFSAGEGKHTSISRIEASVRKGSKC